MNLRRQQTPDMPELNPLRYFLVISRESFLTAVCAISTCRFRKRLE